MIPCFFEKTVETGDRAFLSTLHKFYPENDPFGTGIASAHILDQFDLVRSVLIWMAMRASGTIPERIPGTIVAVFLAINILAGLFYTFWQNWKRRNGLRS